MSSPQTEPTTPDPRRWWILAVLSLSLFVTVMDNAVLTVAIPSLIRSLNTSIADVQWVLDAYIVVFAGLLLTAGGLSDRYGRRLCLIIGLVLFGGASIPTAFASTTGQLIASRALMGAGAAFIMPGTLSILTTVFDEEERKKAIAIWSSVLMLGALGAPLLGGVLLQHFWWGSVFLLNIPIAVVAVVAALLIIPETRGPSNRPDILGSVLSIVGMAALIYGIISSQRDGWSSAPTIVAIVLAVGGLAGFAFWQGAASYPMLPLKLFRNRNFVGASMSLVLVALSSGGLLLALTQFLQFVLGYSALKTGVAFIPLIISAVAFNGLGVMINKRWGARAAIVTGLVLLSAGFALLALVSPGDGYLKLVYALVGIGAGSGTVGPAAYATLLGALPPERAGVGSAVNDTVSQTGQALSVAILGTVLTAFYAAKLPHNITGKARDSIGEALVTAAARHDAGLARAAQRAFVDGMGSTAVVGAIGILAAALLAMTVLTPHPATAEPATAETVDSGVS
ncbi:MFS transporter [Actinomadura sp. DC4]|uniref:MFS transporter n=1 Tax=Actinomadura sp. DC4 TaxID=3055069 RepID=UPI0025B275F9|nr:MFS transporter [Actinomadura sp. DC4]MDN3355694.1 MFS transporter [Actinomadura sp. DC4]